MKRAERNIIEWPTKCNDNKSEKNFVAAKFESENQNGSTNIKPLVADSLK